MISILMRGLKPAIIISIFVALTSAGTLRNVEYSVASSVQRAGMVKQLIVSVNDFNAAHQAASSESILEVTILPFQAEKLLRSNIVDYGIMFFLSLLLTWFVSLIYFTSLSPRANPSIPIAYRRLII
jgi:hypothetical protein